MPVDVRLIAILDPLSLEPKGLDAAKAAEAGGATILQLRMKEGSGGALLQWTERLVRAVTIPVWVQSPAVLRTRKSDPRLT